jgi:isopentenyl-diphosphate delta-isomerase
MCFTHPLPVFLRATTVTLNRCTAFRTAQVDRDDRPLGGVTKKDSHVWANIQAGMLHRAFSVFLFNDRHELLVQRRAASKITFPLHWANTCCSHPVLNVPGEADEGGDYVGVKRAARRKLQQELGIRPEDVPEDSFTYMTRVHYVASDAARLWGEAEVDAVLVCRPPAGTVQLAVNANEVADVRWLRRSELEGWIAAADAAGEPISQWFRLIAASLLPQWWAALEAGADALAERAAADRDAIFRAESPDAVVLVRQPARPPMSA